MALLLDGEQQGFIVCWDDISVEKSPDQKLK
jgi:hypothetical protein